nr:DNA replication licensing factor Mcm2-like [Onthophagus taurus]
MPGGEDSSPPRRPTPRTTSPVADYEPFEDEGALLGDTSQLDPAEEEDGEELFGDNMENDYRPMPALDRYDIDILDEDEYDEISQSDRVAAERELQKRDREEGIYRRGDREIFYDEDDEQDPKAAKRRRGDKTATTTTAEDEEMIESIENLGDTKGYTIKEWVCMMGPRTEVSNRFKNFIRTYVDDKGHYVYKESIRRMCENNQCSFSVDFPTFAHKEHVLAYFLPEAPMQMLEIFDEVAKEIVLSMYPSYERVTSEIHVRISGLPLVEELRTFRKLHVNQLVRTLGVVTATTGVLPQLSIVKYDCNRCGFVLGPFVQSQNAEVQPGGCPECQSSGPFMVKFKNNR